MNIEVLRVIAFKTSDGKLFESDSKAIEHQENIVGELLDGMLPHDDRGNVTHIDRHNLLMKQLEDPNLKDYINKLYVALNYTKE